MTRIRVNIYRLLWSLLVLFQVVIAAKVTCGNSPTYLPSFSCPITRTTMYDPSTLPICCTVYDKECSILTGPLCTAVTETGWRNKCCKDRVTCATLTSCGGTMAPTVGLDPANTYCKSITACSPEECCTNRSTCAAYLGCDASQILIPSQLCVDQNLSSCSDAICCLTRATCGTLMSFLRLPFSFLLLMLGV